jgi:hypothetical protein
LNDDSNGLQLGLSDELGLISNSQKGFPMLCHMGYSYRLKNHKVKDEKLSQYRWRCAKTGGTGVKCKAKITSDTCSIDEECQVTVENAEHSHAPCPIIISEYEQRRQMKERATVGDVEPRKIIAAVCTQLQNDEKKALAPTFEADYQAIWRARKKVQPSYPPVQDIKIQLSCTVIIYKDANQFDSEKIFLYDK